MTGFVLQDGLDYASVLVFALTGALAASRSQLDIVGFIFIACLTAVGGGTLRDAILNREVFWVADPLMLGVATVAAILVFFTAHLLESRYRALLWFDAAALAIAVPAGVAVALAEGQGWSIVLVMGVITGCMGGLLRDVVFNEVPLVLKQGELYATCALAGSLGAVLVKAVDFGEGLALLTCAVVVFILRAGSIALGWRLPVYRSQPPRPGAPKR
ncbi:MAG: trimeric intracellular cation channel family protein [Acetobacteraceae bacterium]|nr:MAG: trimeric intracellular cation channel family protein [Acetobacteraceae bacterium]